MTDAVVRFYQGRQRETVRADDQTCLRNSAATGELRQSCGKLDQFVVRYGYCRQTRARNDRN